MVDWAARKAIRRDWSDDATIAWVQRVLRVAPFLAATLLFIVAYAGSEWGASIRRVGDTSAYETIAAQAPSIASLLQRPPLYPLLLRALAGNETLLIGLQFAAYAGAWVFFAFTLYRLLPRISGCGVALLTYYFALYPDFAGWAPIILTESLSVSLTVVSIAMLIGVFAGGSMLALAGLIFVCAAGALLRDIGGAAALLFAAPVAFLMVRRRLSCSAGSVTIAALTACFLVAAVTSGLPAGGEPMVRRWVFPMLNTIGQRVLPDPDATKRFAEAGMPVTPALMAMANQVAPSANWAFYKAPQLATFRHWLLKHGRTTYFRTVAESPLKYAGIIVNDRADLLDLGQADRFEPYRGGAAGTEWLPRLDLATVYLFGLAGALVLSIAGRRRPDVATSAVFCVSLYAGLPVLALLVYFGDAMEVARHALIVPLYAVLLALTVLAFALRHARGIIPGAWR
jgi:hypothetical protein